MKLNSKFSLAWILLACFLLTLSARAQDLFLQKELGGAIGSIDTSGEVEVSGSFKLQTGTSQGVLSLSVDVASGWHIFSITQKSGGPIPSTITVAESDQYKVVGEFKSDSQPHVIQIEGFDVPAEEHEGTVTWSAPIELAKGVDPEKLKIKMIYNGQTCESKPEGGRCKLINDFEANAAFAGFSEIKSSVIASSEANQSTSFVAEPIEIEEYFPDGLHAQLEGRIVRADGTDAPFAAGDKAILELTAKALEDYHIYTYSLEPPSGSLPTVVGFTQTNGWAVKGPQLSSPPEEGDSFGTPVLWHHDPITWMFEFTIPETAESKTYKIDGIIGMQACNDTGCDIPTGIKFSTQVAVGNAAQAPVQWIETATSLYDKAVQAIEAGGAATPFTDSDPKIGIAQSQQPAGHQRPAGHSAQTVDVNTKTTEKIEHSAAQDTPEQIAAMAKLYDVNKKIKYLRYTEMDDNPIGSGGTSTGDNTTFGTALLGAFLGGMLLNLMPCVFPVLGLKVMGFVQQAGNEASKIRMHGLAFAFGLVVSMWVLAGIIMTLRNTFGQDINWGGQMGNPYFVGFIIVLLFVLGLNMAGVFEIGTSLSGVGGGQKKGYTGSFLSGVLTTLIATPCSGPFLGVAMSYTMAQPTPIAMFLFTIFALGIAFPYLLLSFFPALIGMLPKPGPWMNTFKVTMAFALFATVAFFMQAFGGQTGAGGLSWMVMALVVIGLAAFFYGNWSEGHKTSQTKRLALGFVLPAVIAMVGLWMSYDACGQQPPAIASDHSTGGVVWQQWNPGKVEYSLANKKKIIWVDYTADW